MDKEKIALIESAAKERREPCDSNCQILARRASAITPRSIEWLWPNRFAFGKISLIAGDPGLGKSLLTIAMTAAVTRGGKWPDGTQAPAGDVIMLSAEDDPEDTIVPRLAAAGADLNRVHFVDCIRTVDDEGKVHDREVNIIEHAPMLARMMEDNPEVLLLNIDPISSFLEGTDTHKNAEVRVALKPLAKAAMRQRVAVVCVSHLNKARGVNALHVISGSIAFTATARCCYGVIKDEGDPRRRLFLPMKNNLGGDVDGLAYGIQVNEKDVPVLMWESGTVSESFNDLLSQSTDESGGGASLTEAREWLAAQLHDGPAEVNNLKKSAERDGFSWRTMVRAKKSLGFYAGKRGFNAGWCWSTYDFK